MTLAESLVQNNVNLTILTYSNKLQTDSLAYKYKNINLIYIKTPKLKLDFLTLYQLRIHIVRKYLKSIVQNFDLVHIHGTEHQYEAMLYGLHNKVVISIQGIISECIKILPANTLKVYLEWKLASYYELKYINKYNNFSCRTHWDSSFVKSKNSHANVYMIWEMIRDMFFNDNYNPSSKNILFVGGKNPIKGLPELLFAFNDSLQTKGFKLIILGNCNYDDINSIISNNNLTEIDTKNIDCRGMQDASSMIDVYRDSFCLVHPTYIDNSPNSVCEAQLSGLPVIAKDVGGVSSLIENNITGILINRTSDAIAESVQRLFNDKVLYENISLESKVIARTRHNPDMIIGETINMYKNIVAQK